MTEKTPSTPCPPPVTGPYHMQVAVLFIETTAQPSTRPAMRRRSGLGLDLPVPGDPEDAVG